MDKSNQTETSNSLTNSIAKFVFDYTTFGSLIPNRSWSDASRVYRYGFNGKEKDFETAADNYDFGARIYDGRLGRWLSLDPLMKKFPYESFYLFVSNSPFFYIDINGEEKIIVVGQNASGDVGSRLMFAAQAVSKLKEYSSSNESKTVVLFNTNNAYTEQQVAEINAAIIANGGTLVVVASEADFVQYINTKTTSTFKPFSSSRSEDQITSMDVFSHGEYDEKSGSTTWSFGYGSANSEELKFTKDDVSKLNNTSFTQTAVINSFACRTGAGADVSRIPSKLYGPTIVIDDIDYQRALNETGNSLAQALANHLNVTVNAFVRRTDYSGTFGNRLDRLRYRLKIHDKFKEYLKSNKIVDGALWNSQGAFHQVSAAISPMDATDKLLKFTKNKNAEYSSN